MSKCASFVQQTQILYIYCHEWQRNACDILTFSLKSRFSKEWSADFLRIGWTNRLILSSQLGFSLYLEFNAALSDDRAALTVNSSLPVDFLMSSTRTAGLECVTGYFQWPQRECTVCLCVRLVCSDWNGRMCHRCLLENVRARLFGLFGARCRVCVCVCYCVHAPFGRSVCVCVFLFHHDSTEGATRRANCHQHHCPSSPSWQP